MQALWHERFVTWQTTQDPNAALLALSALMDAPCCAEGARALTAIMSTVTATFSSKTRTSRFICELLFEKSYWVAIEPYISELERLCWALIGYRVYPDHRAVDNAITQWPGVVPHSHAPYHGLVRQCFGAHYASILGHTEDHTPRLIRELLTDTPPFIWRARQCGSTPTLPEDLV